MKEKIIEMLHVQEALDESFMKYKGRTEPLMIEEVRIALLDECGELCHALKADWCYWKKSEEPVNWKEVKEELADVWHFALSLHRLTQGFEFDPHIEEFKRMYILFNWFNIITTMNDSYYNHLYFVIVLTERLGFTFDEMYDAYMEKNKENYERMKRGY